MDHKNVTSALELPGKQIIKNLGLARGTLLPLKRGEVKYF